MDILLCVLAAICLALGVVGCVAPMLPGPPIAYVAMVLLHFTRSIEFSSTALAVWAGIVIVSSVLDYVIPTIGTRMAGGTKEGRVGCSIGTVVGLFFLPWGLIVGPFVGAAIGELAARRSPGQALRSGLGSLLGFLLGTVLKLAICFYFIYEAIAAIVG